MIAEYTQALNYINEKLFYNKGNSTKPCALNIEAAYSFKIGQTPASLAFAYGISKEAAVLNLPRSRYAISLSTSPFKHMTLGLEYEHNSSYTTTNMLNPDADKIITLAAGNLILMSLAVFF